MPLPPLTEAPPQPLLPAPTRTGTEWCKHCRQRPRSRPGRHPPAAGAPARSVGRWVGWQKRETRQDVVGSRMRTSAKSVRDIDREREGRQKKIQMWRAAGCNRGHHRERQQNVVGGSMQYIGKQGRERTTVAGGRQYVINTSVIASGETLSAIEIHPGARGVEGGYSIRGGAAARTQIWSCFFTHAQKGGIFTRAHRRHNTHACEILLWDMHT